METELTTLSRQATIARYGSLLPTSVSGLMQRSLLLDLRHSLEHAAAWPSGMPSYGFGSDWAARRGEHGTLQPYWQIELGPATDPQSGGVLVPLGVRFEHADYALLAAYEPCIEIARTIGGPQGSQPALGPDGWEHTALMSVVPLGASRLLARIWLGQYGRLGGVGYERLLHNPGFTIFYGSPDRQAQSSSPLPDLRIQHSGETVGLRIAQPADILMASVTFTLGDGRWRSQALSHEDGQLATELPAHPALEFFVQTADRSGRVTSLAHSRERYFSNSR
jgi:hypothetical protein